MKMKHLLFILSILLFGFKAESQISISNTDNEYIKWDFNIKKENNLITIEANCKLKDDWHIFSSNEFGDGTINPTKIKIENISDNKNKVVYNEMGNLIDSEIEGIGPVKYFKGTATFQIQFEALRNTNTFKGEIDYQICNEVMCQAPTTKIFTVTLK